MTRNVGPEDRVVRIVVGLGLCIVAYLRLLGDVGDIVAGVVGLYLIVTGILARCLLWKAIDVDTSVQEQSYSTTDDRSGL